MLDSPSTDRGGDQFLTGLLGGLVLSALIGVYLWPRDRPAPEPPRPAFWSQVFGLHLQADAHQPDGLAVFLGDSITQGLAVEAVAPRSVNYAAGGMTSLDLQHMLPRLTSLPRARVVVLTIGTNDLLRGMDGTIPRVLEIGQAIPGPLVWNAIPPSDRFDPAPINGQIRAACAARPRCTYVETPFMADDFRDGVHLSPAGYRKWIASLRSAVAAATSEDVPAGEQAQAQ